MAEVGRKSKYYEYVQPYLKRITLWCSIGATEKEVCRKLGVAVSSFNEYKKEFPELSEALREGKIPADDQVEAELFRRTIGYDYEEVKTNTFVDNANHQRTFRSVTTKHVPGDVRAQIFWLKNRRPDIWRERFGLDHTGPIPVQMFEEEKDL